MWPKEKLMNMDGDILRQLFRSELRCGICYGEDVNWENAYAAAEQVGEIVEMEDMMSELAKLLERYPAFTVEQEGTQLHVQGILKNKRKKRQEISSFLWLQCHPSSHNLVTASVAGGKPFFCNQLEFIDNLEERFGMQLALLIEKDEMLKTFYLEYQAWLAPYTERIVMLRKDFSEQMAMLISEIARSFPEDEAAIMPVRFNVPYFLNRVKRILEQYRLSQTGENGALQLLRFHLQSGETDLECHLDLNTCNAVWIRYIDNRAQYSNHLTLLTDQQIVQLIRELLKRIKYYTNPFCSLFAKDIAEMAGSMLSLEENVTSDTILEALETYLDLFYS